MSVFAHVPHSRVRDRETVGPVTVDAQHDRSTRAARFNAAVAVGVTRGVGSMACAYVFALIALVSLPTAVESGDPVVMVQWLSSVFLQLVLLSIILVGGNVQAAASDKRAADTFLDAEAILHEATRIQTHLQAQDDVLTRLHAHLLAQDEEIGRLAGAAGPSIPAT